LAFREADGGDLGDRERRPRDRLVVDRMRLDARDALLKALAV